MTGAAARPRPGHSRGISLIETLVCLAVLTIALLVTSGAIVRSLAVAESTRERGLAASAARQVLERLRGEDFATIYARYNTVPGDDPGGSGTAPGAAFDVPGLNAADGDPDGRVGEIVFPEGSTAGALSEMPTNEFAATPRDLNMDGDTADADVSVGYVVLPVLVRVRWRGAGIEQDVRVVTILRGGP